MRMKHCCKSHAEDGKFDKSIFDSRLDQQAATVSAKSNCILRRIEEITLNAIKQLAEGNKLSLKVQNRCDWTNCEYENEM